MMQIGYKYIRAHSSFYNARNIVLQPANLPTELFLGIFFISASVINGILNLSKCDITPTE